MWLKLSRWGKHILVFFSLFALSFLIFIQVLVSEKKEVRVPDFSESSWDEVITELDKIGLKGRIENQDFHFFEKKNAVLFQSVAPNKTVMEGRELYFKISKGRDPQWKTSLIGQPWDSAEKLLSNQGITYYQTYHACSSNPSNKVQALRWDSAEKQMNILLEDRPCEMPWVLKSVSKARYLDLFRKEINQKGMDIRMVGAYKSHSSIVTDPSSGSVVQKGDYIVIRNE